ncbi:protein MRG1-like [Asparagus officinalis]|uniref:protein MRG1-like n=1 Tax=Asparagus officinalis TaxID=4686 RepID=UPI00098DF48C|nr:protein MRG1-like [Asparagus officinalis]
MYEFRGGNPIRNTLWDIYMEQKNMTHVPLSILNQCNQYTMSVQSKYRARKRKENKEGEKVLAYHGPQLYEAKVQKSESRKDEWRYYVHYLGWSKNWDEWLEADRMLKFTDENVRKQKELKKQSTEKSSKSGRSIQNKPKSSNDAKLDKEEHRNLGSRGKKRKGQSGLEEKETRSQDKLAILQFPLTLKKQLVDDWEFVTQLGKLVKLPRSPNVDDILKKYLDYRTKKDGMVAESVAEILKGLRCYFDKALMAMLLYKKERQQYHEAVGDKVSPSTIYGAEHLLRLFVKLPELLAYVNMEEEALAKLQQKLSDFLKFLQKNQSTFFLSTYDGANSMDEADD